MYAGSLLALTTIVGKLAAPIEPPAEVPTEPPPEVPVEVPLMNTLKKYRPAIEGDVT